MIVDANPDVLVIVEASWDSAINKIDYMHNNSAFCNAPFVQKADYIKIPFSASALGPRNGAAALDLVSAAIHVTTGATTMNFQSGVEFFDPNVLVSRTAGLLCPLALTDMSYSGVSSSPPPPAPAPPASESTLEDWAIAVIIVFAVLFGVVVVVLSWVIVRERTGAPLFTSKLVDVTSATSKDNI